MCVCRRHKYETTKLTMSWKKFPTISPYRPFRKQKMLNNLTQITQILARNRQIAVSNLFGIDAVVECWNMIIEKYL